MKGLTSRCFSMGIFYNEKNKLFNIFNDEISYLFFINEQGYLQHLYFGSKINDFDFDSFINIGYEWGKTYLDTDLVEKNYDGYYADRSLMEIGFHGGPDKRGAQFIIEHSDKSCRTQFKYVSHRIYSGKPSLETMPYTFSSCEDAITLEIVLVDERQDIELVTSYTVFEKLNIITRNNKLINKSKDIVNLKRAYSFQLDLPESEFDLIHFFGDWSLERYLDRRSIGDGRFTVQSNLGRSSHEENPFIILCDKDCGENHGRAYGFSLVYSGNFSITTNVDKWRLTRMNVGINDEDFSFELKPGDVFEVPEGILVYSNEGLGKLSRDMHDLVREHLIKYKNVHLPRPLLFNSWEGCFMDFNTQLILDYMKHAKEIGAELFVLDDGWFGSRNNDSSALGDWYINEDKINFDKIISECHRLGMKFGLWFEPEMINPDSDLFRKNPKFALGERDKICSLSRHQFVLDTSNDEAVDLVYEMMCAILDKYPIDYIKVDHNRNIHEIASVSSYGETYHRVILGAYKLYGRLIERYPNLFIENCASGGGRFDLGMLYYSPQIWTSDETNPVQRMFIQYGTSFAYPLSSMGAHISKCPLTNYNTKGHVAMFGSYGLEMNPCLLTEDERKQILEVNELYHKYHNEVIQNGDLYRLLSPFDTNYMSMMSVSKDKSKALVFFSNLLKENNRSRYLKLQGLDNNKRYKNSYDGKTYSADYYMNIGLNFTKWLSEFSSHIIILEEEVGE